MRRYLFFYIMYSYDKGFTCNITNFSTTLSYKFQMGWPNFCAISTLLSKPVPHSFLCWNSFSATERTFIFYLSSSQISARDVVRAQSSLFVIIFLIKNIVKRIQFSLSVNSIVWDRSVKVMCSIDAIIECY